LIDVHLGDRPQRLTGGRGLGVGEVEEEPVSLLGDDQILDRCRHEAQRRQRWTFLAASGRRDAGQRGQNEETAQSL
jgi:hypothetical protein